MRFLEPMLGFAVEKIDGVGQNRQDRLQRMDSSRGASGQIQDN